MHPPWYHPDNEKERTSGERKNISMQRKEELGDPLKQNYRTLHSTATDCTLNTFEMKFEGVMVLSRPSLNEANGVRSKAPVLSLRFNVHKLSRQVAIRLDIKSCQVRERPESKVRLRSNGLQANVYICLVFLARE